VKHVSWPDYSELVPKFAFLKTFRLRNTGSSAWPKSAKLLRVSKLDNSLNAPEFVVLGHEVKPDEETDISVQLVTPASAGQYDVYFKLALSEGKKFGQRLRCRILVTANPGVSTQSQSDDEADVRELPFFFFCLIFGYR